MDEEQVESGEAPVQFSFGLAAQMAREDKTADALMHLNYARARIMLEGQECSDPSSPGSRLEATIFLFAELNRRIESLTREQKESAVDRALQLENRNFARRKPDPWICGGGLSEYARGLNVPLKGQPGTAQTTNPAEPSMSAVSHGPDTAWVKKRTEMLPNVRRTLLMLSGIKENPADK